MALNPPENVREWVAWLSPGMMILIGAVLFFIPVPPTSLVGILLMLVGSIFWLVDYFSGDGLDEHIPESSSSIPDDVDAE